MFRLRLEQICGRSWGEFREGFWKGMSEFWEGSWERFRKISGSFGEGEVPTGLEARFMQVQGKFLAAPFLFAFCSCCWGYGQSFALNDCV